MITIIFTLGSICGFTIGIATSIIFRYFTSKENKHEQW